MNGKKKLKISHHSTANSAVAAYLAPLERSRKAPHPTFKKKNEINKNV